MALDSQVQYYALIGEQLHEVTIDDVDQVDRLALITCKYTKPFPAFEDGQPIYGGKAASYIPIRDILRFDRCTLTLAPLTGLRVVFEDGSKIDVHSNTLASI